MKIPQIEDQATANNHLWERGNFVEAYANRDLKPVEVLVLIRYREALGGPVLELGCGAGRLTGYLTALSERVQAIDISPAMISHCKRHYPRGSFRQGDLRDLSMYESGSFDVVAGIYNVLDVLTDAERGACLDDVHRLLSEDGLLVMSSHNLAFAPRSEKPTDVRWKDPRRAALDLSRMPRRLRNHRRMRKAERIEEHYAILNDISHDFRALHYYIERDDQERQLSEHGFELIECLDLDGETVAPDERAALCSELHYVARPIAQTRRRI